MFRYFALGSTIVGFRLGGKTRYKTRKTLEGVRRTNLLAFDALVFWPPDGQGRD